MARLSQQLSVIARRTHVPRRLAVLLPAAVLTCSFAGSASAQQSPSSFGLDLLRGAIGEEASQPKSPPPQRQSEGEPMQTGQVTLVGLLTEDGQRIEQGMVWRIYSARDIGPDGKPRLVTQSREAAPVLKLAPGEYLVLASLGRANLVRRITIGAGAPTTEQFALNVGVLKVVAQLGKGQPAPGSIAFDVFSDERDQFGQRIRVVSAARPGTLLRLNSGLYNVVSQYGDANSTVQADLTVEPGKLTEATVVHHAARVTFKLVMRSGGEALADTQWSILNRQGDIVKESAGALPSHTLAPGAYTVSARSQGRVFRRTFSVRSGENVEVEVLVQ